MIKELMDWIDNEIVKENPMVTSTALFIRRKILNEVKSKLKEIAREELKNRKEEFDTWRNIFTLHSEYEEGLEEVVNIDDNDKRTQ